MEISGTWVNQNGSTVELGVAQDGALSGVYCSRKGRFAAGKSYPLVGRLNGDVIAFHVDWQDDEQVTPLILASSRNHPEIVTLLLSHGAIPAIQDQWGRTALDYAERRGTDDPIAAMLR